MDNLKFTDVDYTELKKDIYYTAVQVSEILNEPVTTIRGWAKDDAFGDLLEIQKDNGRRKYTGRDIENLKFIKELIDKKYSYAQIREIISKRGFGFGEYNSGLIDVSDPLGFEALAIKITQKQDEKLALMQKNILENLKEFSLHYLKIQEEKLNIALEEFNDELSFKLNNQEKSLEEMKDNICTSIDESVSEKLDNSIKEIKETFEISYVTKEELEKDKTKKKGNFWKRIFNYN